MRLITVLLIVALSLPWAAVSAAMRLPGRAVPVEEVTPLLGPPAATYHVPRAHARPVLDGKADEWQGIPAMVLDRKEQTGGKWTGPADLSGALRLQWDTDYLYFCVDVTDDVHVASDGEKGFWGSDGMQFAFDAYRNGPRWGYDNEELSFMACDAPQGAMMAGYRARGQEEDVETRIPAQAVVMTAKPGGGYILEWAMPWARLAPVSPAFLGRCGFTFTLNDNDGAGYKNALVWTPGIVNGSDAARFGQLCFDGAAGARDAALPLPPEASVFADETRSRWMDLPGLPPCRTARLLYYAAQGGPVTAQVAVYRPGARAPLATGAVTATAAAGGMLAFAWDLAALPTGDYEVVFNTPPSAALPEYRYPYQQINVAHMRFTKAQLRERFGLDRPLDDLATAPAAIRRNRGLAALLMQYYEDRIYASTARLASPMPSVLKPAQVVEMLQALAMGTDYLGTPRRQRLAAYYSPADGSGQPFVLTLPAKFSPAKTYPLIVTLHGSNSYPMPAGTGRFPDSAIVVEPWGRGSNGYQGLGEDDVLRVIAYLREWYRIDPDRIYITGGSMGGHGTWLLATRHPDLFAAAAPVYGYGEGLPVENLRNVPVFNQHGQVDWRVSILQSRYPVSVMQQLGYPVLHKEYPTFGHQSMPDFQVKDPWLLNFRRNARPEAITYTCETPAQGMAYWINIRQFADAHQVARVQARVTCSGQAQGLTLLLDNVAALECDLTNMPVDRKLGLQVQIGTEYRQLDAPLPARLVLQRTDGQWAMADQWTPPASAVRPYRAGAAANLYEGEPLLIVYGAAGGEERAQMLREAAEALTGFAGSSDQRMACGSIPMKADTEVTEEDLAGRNLILLGGARDNLLTARLAARLPITITEKNALLAGDREPVSLDGAGLCLAYYNPLAPARFLYLVATDAPVEAARPWYARAQDLLLGAHGLGRVEQADLAVLSVADGAARRYMQFTDGWQWRQVDGAEIRLPAAMAFADAQTAVNLRVMRRLAHADFALDWADRPGARWFDPQWFTRADTVTVAMPRKLMVVTMTGEELRGFYAAAVARGDASALPATLPADLDPHRAYRVAMPPSCGWELAFCKITPRDAHALPDWPATTLWDEIFAP